MRPRTRRRLRTTIIALLAVLAFVAVGQVHTTPDVTLARVEHDMAGTFANQFLLANRIAGHPLDGPIETTATCDKGGPSVPDQGPGRNWICNVHFVDPTTGKPTSIRYELQVRGEACYIAINPRLIEKPSIRDATTGATVPNPLAQFDGCFDVYDSRTATSAVSRNRRPEMMVARRRTS
ncbi:MAG: hypothetical protein WCJ67_01290 [Thermoleophilia bacterium]